MKNVHGVLHGMQWIMFHGLVDFASSQPQRFGSNLTQNWETFTLQNLTTLDILYLFV